MAGNESIGRSVEQSEGGVGEGGGMCGSCSSRGIDESIGRNPEVF